MPTSGRERVVEPRPKEPLRVVDTTQLQRVEELRVVLRRVGRVLVHVSARVTIMRVVGGERRPLLVGEEGGAAGPPGGGGCSGGHWVGVV